MVSYHKQNGVYTIHVTDWIDRNHHSTHENFCPVSALAVAVFAARREVTVEKESAKAW